MRTTHILNSATMPIEGCYSLKQISSNDFFAAIKEAEENDPDHLRSWIGYKQNADIIEQKTGLSVRITRDNTWLQHGDRLLIMRLKYRVGTVARKGDPVDAADFEYFEGYYTERVPVPAYVDILNLDIYEPNAQRYINDLAKLTGAGTVLHALKYTRKLMLELEDGEEQRWSELHKDYTDLLMMHFDSEGYSRQREKEKE